MGASIMARRRLAGAALLVVAAAGLGAAPALAEGKPAKGRIYKIGYAQIVEHPMFDEMRRGLLDGLAAAGFEQAKNMVFDYEYANGDAAKARAIARQFIADKVDLMAPCSAPDALASVEVARGGRMPVVFGCVFEPVAAGILKSADRPTGTNVTGIFGPPPIKESFDLFLQIRPGLKRIGTIYNGADRDSVALDAAAKAEAARRGLEWVAVTVTASVKVKATADSLAGKVDALVIGPDYTVATAYADMVKAARAAHLPVFALDVSAVGRGAIAALGPDPYKAGLDWARALVVPVLLGKDPGTLEPVRLARYDLHLDLAAAEAAGVTVPPAVVAKAVKKPGG
jgi:putative ABC transport system substrate-binding protein